MESQDTDQLHGALFAGRYVIKRLLGSGGMGKVYLVSDQMLGDEQIALKVLHPDLCADERQTKRFLREVQLTRRVTHGAVVRTFDVGAHDGQLFFTMEYIQGETLKDRLTASGVIEPYEAARILLEVCVGLESIHRSGIIHRDLKPANVILCCDGQTKIADFGVARPGASDLTGHDEVVGSAAYMGPEVWEGADVTAKTDLYALGVMAFELVTGALPFDGASPAEVMKKHLMDTAAPVSSIRPDVPMWFEMIITRLMARDPASRPESALGIARIIEEKLNRRGSAAPASEAPTVRTQPGPVAPPRSPPVPQSAVIPTAQRTASMPAAQTGTFARRTATISRPILLSPKRRVIRAAATVALTAGCIWTLVGPLSRLAGGLWGALAGSDELSRMGLGAVLPAVIAVFFATAPVLLWGVTRAAPHRNLFRWFRCAGCVAVLWGVYFAASCVQLGLSGAGTQSGVRPVLYRSVLDLTAVGAYSAAPPSIHPSAATGGDFARLVRRDPGDIRQCAMYYSFGAAVLLVFAGLLRREITGKRGFLPKAIDLLTVGGIVASIFLTETVAALFFDLIGLVPGESWITLSAPFPLVLSDLQCCVALIMTVTLAAAGELLGRPEVRVEVRSAGIKIR